MQFAKLPTGLDAKIVGKRRSCLLVAIKRLSLTSGAVESEHQLAPKLLPQRMSSDQTFQLSHQLGVASPRQVTLNPVLQTGKTELFQASDLGLSEAPVRELG